MNIMYPNKDNMLMAPYNKSIGDYYKNICLSLLIDELWFSRKWWKINLSSETKRLILCIPTRRTCQCCPITKERRLLQEFMFVSFDDELFSKRKWWKKKLFLQNQLMHIVYPNEENMFMAPFNKGIGDYYKNTCLSLLMNKLWF